jgi:hypothetical protein
VASQGRHSSGPASGRLARCGRQGRPLPHEAQYPRAQ